MPFLRTLIATLTLCTLSAAAAENHTFQLLDAKGATIATASFAIDKGKDGLKVRSSIDYKNENLFDRNISYKINPGGLFLTGEDHQPRQNTLTSYTPSKSRDSLNIMNSKVGESAGERKLTLSSPDFLVLFNEDPSVWQIFLNHLQAHPHDDGIYTLLVPSPNNWTQDKIEHVAISKPTESTGTLAGAPVKLQHFIVKFAGSQTELYADTDGKLMQSQNPRFGFKQVRTGFTLIK